MLYLLYLLYFFKLCLFFCKFLHAPDNALALIRASVQSDCGLYPNLILLLIDFLLLLILYTYNIYTNK